MIINVYSIYDLKACVYGTPYFILNDQVAIRMFSDLVNDERSNVYRHPEDYVLYVVGSFDDSSGEIMKCVIRHVVNAVGLKKGDGNGAGPGQGSGPAYVGGKLIGKGLKEVVQ